MKPGLRKAYRPALLAVVLALLIAGTGAAQQFRNIASFSVDYNFDSTFETTLEDVFLAPLTDTATLEARVQQISGSDRGLTLLSLGPVFNITPTLYTISVYGIGFDSNGEIVHEVDLQGHYETADFRIGLGARGRLFPADDFFYVVPSVGGWVNLPGGFGLQATYFFSWNSDDEISNALWTEVDYRLSDIWTVKLGGTVDYGDDPGRVDSSRTTFSGITGASAALSESVNLRYHFEYFGRTNAANGLKNLVLVDWRF